MILVDLHRKETLSEMDLGNVTALGERHQEFEKALVKMMEPTKKLELKKVPAI